MEKLPQQGAHRGIPDRNEPDKLQERAECEWKRIPAEFKKQ
jgi:hypothetical protein